MTLLWQKADWPSFRWSNSELIELLVKARFEQGRLLSLPLSFVHSFELNETKTALYKDLVESQMTLERLFGWQASLFPTGYSGVKKIKIAEFRNKELSQAPLPNKRIPDEVQKFLSWWGEPPVELDPVLRSGLAFFWFLTLSPFEDGNFDLACAFAELALQQEEKTQTRTYDISLQLSDNFDDVHKKIDAILKGSGDITEWLVYYLELYLVAVRSSYAIADKNQSIELFWKKFSRLDLNSRQRKILNLMLDESSTMTNREYVKLCKTSRESAKRDLTKLVTLGVLKRGEKKGRSVEYYL